VQASPFSSKRSVRRRARRARSSTRSVLGVALVSLSLLAAGCVTVKPQDKELLADPSMVFNADGMAQQHEAHVLENREGSYGGTSTRGGGCGCN
jgi:hypothetical protein